MAYVTGSLQTRKKGIERMLEVVTARYVLGMRFHYIALVKRLSAWVSSYMGEDVLQKRLKATIKSLEGDTKCA